MESRKSQIAINIILIICLLFTLIFDFWLSRFGQETFVFNANFPQEITFEHDNLQGYKFLEEGFIHILDENTIHGEDTIVAILAYHVGESDIYVKARSNTGKIIYLNIHLIEPSKGELKYELIEDKSIRNNKWIDVSNKQRIRFIVSLRYILLGFIIVLCIIKLIRWLVNYIKKG